MKYIGIVEIPKGCDRRIHKSIETGEFIDFGSIKEVIPVNEGKMPVCYGFLKNVINKTEGDEVDLLIFSNKKYKTGGEVDIELLGMIEREDGDHKIVAKDNTVLYSNLEEVNQNEWKLILSYFGFKHKIISIKNKEIATQYVVDCSSD